MSTYTSSTTTTEKRNVTLSKNESYYILTVDWEHANQPDITVELQDFPLAIKARATDGLMHYSMKVEVGFAKHEIITLDGAYYDVSEGKFHVHIPHVNMKLKMTTTATLRRK